MYKILPKVSRLVLTIFFGLLLSFIFNSKLFLTLTALTHKQKIETPIVKSKYEIFGFAPYWTIDKLDNVDYSVLTTMAYFGVPLKPDGTLDEENVGYVKMSSDNAKTAFDKARSHGTRVVVTVTQMNNDDIKSLLDDSAAQKKSIKSITKLVSDNHFDGVNIDFEYVGNPGQAYREEFSNYIKKLTSSVHKSVPNSQVTLSVYATAVKDPKLYDIGELSSTTDEIFMMAYDFATRASTNAIPTSPLYGYREGKYWYDVSTAVEDFLKVMPAEKLVLGLPWYGYDYPVTEPGVKVARYEGYYYNYYYRGRRYTAFQSIPASTQTIATASTTQAEKTGWDDIGKVGWRAYKEDGVWRMVFLEDSKSLSLKYQFAKSHNLKGVGVWALGFDAGSTDMWDLLSREFGTNLAYNSEE